MSAPAARIRLLLLALGLTAILGLLYWPEAEEQSWAPNPNYVRDASGPAAPTAAAAAAAAAPVGEPEEQAPPRNPILSDSEFVKVTADYGLVSLLREYGGERGSFHFVDLRDSTRSLRSLGFIQASVLLDSARRFATLGDSGPAGVLALASTAPADSVLRRRMEDCSTDVPVPVRDGSHEDRWTLALMPGAQPALPDGEWRRRPSAADRAEALRLARQVLPDSTEGGGGFQVGTAWVPQAPEIRSLHRFTRDGTDVLVADVRIEHRKRHEAEGGGDRGYEQRLFIAERDSGDRAAPFRIVWSRQDAGYGDETSTEEPKMVLRLGDDRLLTLNTSGDYKDGGGGLFISRVGKGEWRVVASWYAGC